MRFSASLGRRRFGMRARPAQHAYSAVLPLEIQFLIIDEFEGQTANLRELCRVCLAWAERAQSLLFRNICVRFEHRKRFLAVLNTKHNLGRHVMALKVINDRVWWNDLHHFLLLEELALIEQLPHLRTLDFSAYFARWSEGAPSRPLQPATMRSAISRICLNHCTFDNAETLIAVVAAFPHLESLYICHCDWKDTFSQLRSTIARPEWHLKYLALGHIQESTFFDWLVAEPASLTVDHLRIMSIGPNASTFNALLVRIGDGLRRLELPGMHYWVVVPEVPLSVRGCTALTTLTFSGERDLNFGNSIPSVLAQVASTSPPLTVVVFHIPLDTRYFDVPWEQVDALLASDVFTLLERVECHVFQARRAVAHRFAPYAMAVLHMKRRMRLLQDRGLLRFVDADPEEGPAPAYVLAPLPTPRRPTAVRQKRLRRLRGWISRAGVSIPFIT